MKDKKVKVEFLRTVSVPEGNFVKGDQAEVSESTVEGLEKKGLAKKVAAKKETKKSEK